jgi:hypothetical protein
MNEVLQEMVRENERKKTNYKKKKKKINAIHVQWPAAWVTV